MEVDPEIMTVPVPTLETVKSKVVPEPAPCKAASVQGKPEPEKRKSVVHVVQKVSLLRPLQNPDRTSQPVPAKHSSSRREHSPRHERPRHHERRSHRRHSPRRHQASRKGQVADLRQKLPEKKPDLREKLPERKPEPEPCKGEAPPKSELSAHSAVEPTPSTSSGRRVIIMPEAMEEDWDRDDKIITQVFSTPVHMLTGTASRVSGLSKRQSKQIGSAKWFSRKAQIKFWDIQAEVYCAATLTGRQRQVMPHVRLSEIINKLKGKDGFILKGTNIEKQGNWRYFVEGEKINLDAFYIAGFVQNVRRFRILVLDTEGPDGLVDQYGKPRLFIILGDFDGNVLMFASIHDVPDVIIELLNDWTIIKLQSNVVVDIDKIAEITENKIRVRGWVDSPVIYRAFMYPSVGQNEGGGAKCQARAIGQAVEHRAYVHAGKGKTNFAPRKPNDTALLHAIMDGRLSLATVFEAVLRRAVHLHYHETDDVFPLIWEALSLARGVGQEDFKVLDQDENRNWIAGSHNISAGCDRLNSARGIAKFRQAEGEFVCETRKQIDRATRHELALKLYGNAPLPGGKVYRQKSVAKMLEAYCANCGEKDHKIAVCPEPKSECKYEHGCAGDKGPHSTLMCPVLHNECPGCFTRGHVGAEHEVGSRMTFQLRDDFLHSQHLGKFTCAPLIADKAGQKERVHTAHWILGSTTMPLNKCAADAYYWRMEDLPENFEASVGTTVEQRREAVQRERDQRLKYVIHNFEAEFPGDYIDPARIQGTYQAVIVTEAERRKEERKRKHEEDGEKAREAKRVRTESQKASGKTPEKPKASHTKSSQSKVAKAKVGEKR